MTLTDLQKQIFEINKANGWHDKVPSKLEQHALFHTEITEAYNEFVEGRLETWYQDDGKPEGFYTELADVVIRILDYFSLEDYLYVLESGFTGLSKLQYSVKGGVINMPGLQFIVHLHSEISRSVESIRNSDLSTEKQILESVIIHIDCYLHHSYRQSLTDLIKEKIAYNKTRGHRHGNKQI